MYNTYQDKSSRKTPSTKTPKPFETSRWDHGGFDQLQSERKQQEDERNDRYRKSRRYQNDDTLASDMLDSHSQPEKSRAEAGKWAHDKFEENSNISPAQPGARPSNEPEKPSRPNKREKRPDRQLYSVRGKRGSQEETKTQGKESFSQEGIHMGKTQLLSDEVMRGTSNRADKEVYVYEDDNRSSVSNVSTALSDPLLKGNEEESGNRRDLAYRETQERLKEVKKEPEAEVLLEIVLDAEQREVIKVYESEDNYERQLEDACQRMGMGKRVSLYLKINVMKAIQDVHPEPQKLDAALDRLLDFNHRLIMVDDGQEEADEALLPYFDEGELLDIDLSMDQNDISDMIDEGAY